MVRLPGGSYLHGDDRFYPEEGPVRVEQVDPMWVDAHPVTNAEFRRFVKATGHVTRAELTPQEADFEGALLQQPVAGSLVFVPTPGPVQLDDWTRWWDWVPGTSWRHPLGPDSTLHGRDLHPVVHVGLEDARAYAGWAGKVLPTEVEWEFAARGGLVQAIFAWGDDFTPRGKVMANTWHGRFPWENLRDDGRAGTSPVGRYPPNGFGLYDVTGNVWEWTNTVWEGTGAQALNDDLMSQPLSKESRSCCAPQAPRDALVESDRYVTKGGSHLCAPSYCLRYRPAARQGHSVRSSTSHLGFRCILRD
jgi:sulfatase modifying factor 1